MDDAKYICPPPRASVACENCKVRKTRCLLRDKQSKVCRRCAKLGYRCVFTRSTPDRRQAGPSIPDNSSKEHPAVQMQPPEGDDIISSLFNGEPEHENEAQKLVDFHRGVFPKRTRNVEMEDHYPTPSGSTADSSISGGNRFDEQNDELTTGRAEELLNAYRSTGLYFPFVKVDEDATIAMMTTDHPFLLLSTLTIAAYKIPKLWQRLNKKFLQVLSDRIVIHGEKDLDYLQGLLVYIAWYPMHLRPMSSQISQFLTLAGSMISDLRLDLLFIGDRDAYSRQGPMDRQRKMGLIGDVQARNACLGWFYISSNLSLGFHKLNSVPITSIIRSYLLSREVKERARDDFCLRIAHIQSMIDLASRSDPESQRLLADFNSESSHSPSDLVNPDNVTMNNLHNPVSFRLSQLHFALVTRKTIYLNNLSNPFPITNALSASGLNFSDSEEPDTTILNACIDALNDFMEYFLSLLMEEYMKLSHVEWARLVLAIQAASEICLESSVPRQQTDILRKERAKLLIYFESLSHRLEKLSQPFRQPGQPPDHFLLFNSVLQVVSSAYLPDRPVQPHSTPGHRSPTDQKDEYSRKSSRCPILNGKIRQTEYWNALQESQKESELSTEGLDGISGGLDWPNFFEDVFDDSQCSASLFPNLTVQLETADMDLI